MPHYPPERKQSVLAKMGHPNPVPISQLAQLEGISLPTLYNWRKEARAAGHLLPDADAGPQDWSAQDRFNAVLQTASMPEADLAEYCRTKGLYPQQIQRWKEACLSGCDFNAAPAVPRQAVDRERRGDKKRIALLERDLNKKDKALAEAAAIIILQKKLAPLLGVEDA